ncbi:hypothetical protein C1Y63_08990 [Corynebacterium sp. 13CS0277]|uniref:hypothetical protein n=1 Tax=Corynebacterium sp. 13CS0277 TaxID=2071994 RepID=UPI000D02C73B|nr:hypothetical protein [Corynebacterium sp. 13CS0277]PRQ10869.1 hypothetical protein C1Y63_08990 [Corynebacterium sp. 13CS0277]
MNFSIDPFAVRQSLATVEEAAACCAEATVAAASAPINGSYSSVPGLAELAVAHQELLVGGPGSAEDVCRQLAARVTWLRDALRATGEALCGQELHSARGLEYADEACGVAVAPDAVVFPARPDSEAREVPMSRPQVLPGESLLGLSLGFATTDSAQPVAAADVWRRVAQLLERAAERIRAAVVLPGCEGAVFEQARRRMESTAADCDTVAANARIIAADVGVLPAVRKQGAQEVQQIAGEVRQYTDPAERAAKETELVDSWLVGPWQDAIDAATPRVTCLLVAAEPASAATTLGVGLASGVGGLQGGARTLAQSVAPLAPAPAGGTPAPGAAVGAPGGPLGPVAPAATRAGTASRVGRTRVLSGSGDGGRATARGHRVSGAPRVQDRPGPQAPGVAPGPVLRGHAPRGAVRPRAGEAEEYRGHEQHASLAPLSPRQEQGSTEPRTALGRVVEGMRQKAAPAAAVSRTHSQQWAPVAVARGWVNSQRRED